MSEGAGLLSKQPRRNGAPLNEAFEPVSSSLTSLTADRSFLFEARPSFKATSGEKRDIKPRQN